ncbi:MAG: hypothetical protein COT14_03190 [Candidatus Diapherotrites archaeon CG08_land_8_20_14_0_20_30_16]|nr:MAG: hypothetical protein COT14_03190 [Candidatus Diapherotrites archaeon CG08_land_8_20_14_0_20_30_16]
MAEKSGKWFAILVIVIFIVSTFSVLLYNQSQDEEPEKKVVEDPTKDLPIQYKAEVNGKVLEVPTNSSFRLIGYTNESQVDLIDKSIRDLNNVYNVAGSLIINKDTNTVDATYVYVTDVVGTNIDTNYFYSSVKSNQYFLPGQTNTFPYAKIDYNSLVNFENKDLNVAKMYDLGGNQIIVLVDPNTFIGDEISFAIAAQFKGDSLAGYNAFELKNLSEEPKAITSIYNGKFNKDFYAIAFDVNIPQDKFSVIGTENKDYNYFPSSNATTITIDKDKDLPKYLSLLGVLEKDYNTKLTTFAYGSIFVDKINYLDKNYDVNRNVNVSMDYNQFVNLQKDLEYNITAYLVRDKIVSVSATPLFGVDN